MRSPHLDYRSVDEIELAEVDLADPLGPARGIIFGLCFAAPVWAVVIAAAWWLLP